MRQLHPKRKWKTIQNMYWYEQDGHHIFALRDNKSVRVARLAELEITEHKPIRLSFHPYLDQGYYLWLQRRRDDQKVSGAKRRGIWRRQAGRCHYCGRPMLPDQEIRLVELVLGRGRTVSNLAYIHQSCAYDVVIEGKEGDSSGLMYSPCWMGVTEPVRGLEDPYWDLREVFRLCRQPSVTLTFQEIERIIGFELDWEARYFQAFWFDEAPAYVGSQWEKEFPISRRRALPAGCGVRDRRRLAQPGLPHPAAGPDPREGGVPPRGLRDCGPDHPAGAPARPHLRKCSP